MRGLTSTIIRPFGVSYGIGVNSTAMLIALFERGIIPDYILAADTAGNDPQRRGEKPETYEYLDSVFGPWVKKNMGMEITTVRHSKDSLRNSCFRNGTLPSKAYSFPGCSVKFKHQIMERWEIKTYGPDVTLTKAIGYHSEEERGSRISAKGRYLYIYPLKEFRINQQGCVNLILRHGLPVPIKSACYFCPSSKPHEIEWLRDNHPELFEDALAMEKNAEPYHLQRLLDDGTPQTKGLGRKFSWSKFVQIGADISDLPEPDEIPCMCYDGE